MAATKLQQSRARRPRDPEQTRAEILQVAADEFAEHGFAGARVDRIAAQMRTTKRMIYYYFGSKEDLYLAVLERAYSAIRRAEQEIDVDHLDPIAAIRRLAELTFDHHEANPSFLRLVSIENVHRAEHLRRSSQIANLNVPAIDLIARILERGYASGAFVRRVDAIDLHMMISAFCVFRVANQHTFGVIFERDLTSPDLRDRYREMLADMVVSYLVST
jgi:AcrR family transcriptional regulator